MDVTIEHLPFPLRSYGPEGHWAYGEGVLTGRAGARQDRCRRPARHWTPPPTRPASSGRPKATSS